MDFQVKKNMFGRKAMFPEFHQDIMIEFKQPSKWVFFGIKSKYN